MDVQFEDNSIYVKGEINDAVIAALHSCSGELVSQTQRNCRVDTENTKGAWTYEVDESEGIATIGNPLENAIWEEFGTGEYAVNGDGRKGYWVFVKGSSTKSNNPKTYTLDEARKMVAIMRSEGLDAYYTNGKKPTRAFEKAFTSMKSKIVAILESALKGIGS